MIKCDHWDYCLGDNELPNPHELDRFEMPFDDDPVEVEIRNPIEENVATRKHQGAYFPRYSKAEDFEEEE